MDAVVFDADPSIRHECQEILKARLRGATLASDCLYKLSRMQMIRELPNGTTQISSEIDGIQLPPMVVKLEWELKDLEGNVIQSSHLARIEEIRTEGELVQEHKDNELGQKLLASYEAALGDPGNELVHLYEIQDALRKKFGSKRSALQGLGITEKEWSRFGKLTNVEPLRQARHRGLHLGLRDATEGELQEARGLAKRFIRLYFLWLNRQESD